MSEYTAPEPPIHISAAELTPTFASITDAYAQFDATRQRFAIDAALEIAPVTDAIVTPLEKQLDAGGIDEAASMGERELHRIRKVAEVYEDALRIRLPTSSLYRLIRTAGTMSSIGGIFIALSGLDEAAGSIEQSVRRNGEGSVPPSRIDDFYFASGVFFGELVLLATPFPGQLAFQTTGRLHSRLLWQRFRQHRAEYRLLLHHIYTHQNPVSRWRALARRCEPARGGRGGRWPPRRAGEGHKCRAEGRSRCPARWTSDFRGWMSTDE